MIKYHLNTIIGTIKINGIFDVITMFVLYWLIGSWNFISIIVPHYYYTTNRNAWIAWGLDTISFFLNSSTLYHYFIVAPNFKCFCQHINFFYHKDSIANVFNIHISMGDYTYSVCQWLMHDIMSYTYLPTVCSRFEWEVSAYGKVGRNSKL